MHPSASQSRSASDKRNSGFYTDFLHIIWNLLKTCGRVRLSEEGGSLYKHWLSLAIRASHTCTARVVENCTNWRQKGTSDSRWNSSDNTVLPVDMHRSTAPRCSGPVWAETSQHACTAVLSFPGRCETAPQLLSQTLSLSEGDDQNYKAEKTHLQQSPGKSHRVLWVSRSQEERKHDGKNGTQNFTKNLATNTALHCSSRATGDTAWSQLA